MFERIISVDWSGAAAETKRVDLRVVMHDATTRTSHVVNAKNGNREVRGWSRAAFRDWLKDRLREPRKTLYCFDFGFGFPWGADSSVFGVKGWREMLRVISQMYSTAGTARATALLINASPQFNGHGPFRFNESRSDFRFHIDSDVAYFRLTELVTPQAISQWYLGSGGTVGFHTISGLAAVSHFLDLRDQNELDFVVWPHETLQVDGSRNVFAESYPAIYPVCDFANCRDSHQRDAWKALQYFAIANQNGSLVDLFNLQSKNCGRFATADFEDQIQFEGWILGLK